MSDATSSVDTDARFRPGGKMLEGLVCPLTHGLLEYDRAACELVSRKAGLAFPVRDGIPIMLESEARKLEG